MSRVQQLRDLLAADCISQTEYARLMPAAMLSDQQDAYGQAVYRHQGEGLLGVGHAIANQALRAQSYLTRAAVAPAPPAIPDVHVLTRAMFGLDADVRRHARLNGEVPPMGRYGGSFQDGVRVAAEHARLEAAAINKAWARAIFGYQPERGWAETAKVQALLLRDALKEHS